MLVENGSPKMISSTPTLLKQLSFIFKKLVYSKLILIIDLCLSNDFSYFYEMKTLFLFLEYFGQTIPKLRSNKRNWKCAVCRVTFRESYPWNVLCLWFYNYDSSSHNIALKNVVNVPCVNHIQMLILQVHVDYKHLILLDWWKVA